MLLGNCAEIFFQLTDYRQFKYATINLDAYCYFTQNSVCHGYRVQITLSMNLFWAHLSNEMHEETFQTFFLKLKQLKQVLTEQKQYRPTCKLRLMFNETLR